MIHVDKDSFAVAVKMTANNADESQRVQPSMGTVLLECRDDTLYLTGANLVSRLCLEIPANTGAGEEWSVSVPASRLASVAAGLSEDVASLTFLPQDLVLKYQCGRSSGQFQGMDAHYFPLRQLKGSEPMIEVDGELYQRAFDAVKGYANGKDPRPLFTGVQVDFGDTITMQALDGFRMTKATLVGQTAPRAFHGKSVVLPVTSLGLAKLMDGTVRISLSDEGHMSFAGDGWYFDILTINTKTLDISGFIPDGTTYSAIVETEPFADACRSSLPMASKGESIRFDVSDPVDGWDGVRVMAFQHEVGVASSVFPMDAEEDIEPGEHMFKMSTDYLKGLNQQVKKLPEFELGWSTPQDVIFISYVDDGIGVISVIQPMA